MQNPRHREPRWHSQPVRHDRLHRQRHSQVGQSPRAIAAENSALAQQSHSTASTEYWRGVAWSDHACSHQQQHLRARRSGTVGGDAQARIPVSDRESRRAQAAVPPVRHLQDAAGPRARLQTHSTGGANGCQVDVQGQPGQSVAQGSGQEVSTSGGRRAGPRPGIDVAARGCSKNQGGYCERQVASRSGASSADAAERTHSRQGGREQWLVHHRRARGRRDGNGTLISSDLFVFSCAHSVVPHCSSAVLISVDDSVCRDTWLTISHSLKHSCSVFFNSDR